MQYSNAQVLHLGIAVLMKHLSDMTTMIWFYDVFRCITQNNSAGL